MGGPTWSGPVCFVYHNMLQIEFRRGVYAMNPIKAVVRVFAHSKCHLSQRGPTVIVVDLKAATGRLFTWDLSRTSINKSIAILLIIAIICNHHYDILWVWTWSEVFICKSSPGFIMTENCLFEASWLYTTCRQPRALSSRRSMAEVISHYVNQLNMQPCSLCSSYEEYQIEEFALCTLPTPGHSVVAFHSFPGRAPKGGEINGRCPFRNHWSNRLTNW